MTNQLESNNLSSLQWYNKDHIAKPFVSFNSEAFISFNASAQSILPPYVTIAYNEKNDEICIAPSDKKIGISIKYSKSSLPSLTRFMSKNNIKFPIKYYIQTNDSSNSYFLATSEFVDENILIERVLKLIKKDNLSAMKSDSMEKLLNLYDSFIKSYIRKRKYSFIPLEDRLSLGKEGFIHAIVALRTKRKIFSYKIQKPLLKRNLKKDA